MANTGKSNAHLGVSHPFGAKHNTLLGASRGTLIGAGHDTRLQAQKAVLKKRMPAKGWQPVSDTVPVAPDAPLEERMYPDKIEDIVARHSQNEHKDVQPYKPAPGAAVPFYQLGVRPLDASIATGYYGDKFLWRDQHVEHMHFLGSDGKSNFGMMKEGQVRADSPELLQSYEALPYKFNAALIDRALAEWSTEQKERDSKFALHGNNAIFRKGEISGPYSLFFDNCEDFAQKIINRAAKYQTPDNPLILP